MSVCLVPYTVLLRPYTSVFLQNRLVGGGQKKSSVSPPLFSSSFLSSLCAWMTAVLCLTTPGS
uniref:Uncharacterized protein n=2 Tax=Anguilla anguilla TaxID=7936 RepID=A0A0E9V8J2_ANGAN